MDSTRSFLQSSATSDSCVNVKKQRKNTSGGKGAEPLWKPFKENNDALLARGFARQQGRHCTRSSQGLSPRRGGIFTFSKR